MTDVVEYRPNDPAGQLVAWADAARAAHALCQSLVTTAVCPAAFRNKPEEATAVVLLGAEIGLSPIASLRSMFDIKGTIGMYVDAQVALVKSHGHRIWTVSESDDAVTVAGHRAGDPDHVEEVTFTLARARQAGFIRKGRNGEPSQYELQPRVMLWARAAGIVARRIAPDALAGIPQTDDPGEPSGALTAAPGASGRVVQRRPVVPPAPAGGVDPAADQESPPAAGQDENLPPDEPPDEPEPDEPVRLSEAQRARIMVGLSARGVRTHDHRVHYLSALLDHDVESTNDLTPDEASAVIDHLEWEGREP